MCLIAAGMFTACSMADLVTVDDPESIRQLDRDLVKSRAGALGMYYGALGQLQDGVSKTSFQVALFTDEVTYAQAGTSDGRSIIFYFDDARVERLDQGGPPGLEFMGFKPLQAARVRALQARTVLKNLEDSTLRALIANTYTIEGYSILLLAENLCSGVPLTNVPFEGDVVYSAGYSTRDAFTIAIAKFDSALAITHDSARYTVLAKIGKGRAYLGLGDYKRASEAVATIEQPDVFRLYYTDVLTPGVTASPGLVPPDAFWTTTVVSLPSYTITQTINNEGTNGMAWYTDPTQLDPRLPVTTTIVGGVTQFPAVVRQRKFIGGTLVFPLARWIEAKMIQAEYALSSGDVNWIDHINEARQTVGLANLSDPEARDARVTLLFHERAFWFYMEGIRLSDYRRMVRQYGRDPYLLYPVGAYTRSNGSFPLYGDAFVLSAPAAEYANNYMYQGCQNKNP